jgi:hypothetical protein
LITKDSLLNNSLEFRTLCYTECLDFSELEVQVGESLFGRDYLHQLKQDSDNSLPIRIPRFTEYLAKLYCTNLHNHVHGNYIAYISKFIKTSLIQLNEQHHNAHKSSTTIINKALQAILVAVITNGQLIYPENTSSLLMCDMEYIHQQLSVILVHIGAIWTNNELNLEQAQIIKLFWCLLKYCNDLDIKLLPQCNFTSKHITMDKSFLPQLRSYCISEFNVNLPTNVSFSHFFNIKKYRNRFKPKKRKGKRSRKDKTHIKISRRKMDLVFLQTDGVSASLVFGSKNRRKRGRPKGLAEKVITQIMI